LSGLAHPVMEPDHLIFIVAIGLASTLVARGARIARVFVVALLAGVLAHVTLGGLPIIEILVATSIILAGMALVRNHVQDQRLWAVFAGFTGAVHGFALGGPIAAASGGVVLMFLIGVAITLAMLIFAIQTFLELMLHDERANPLKIQAAGGAVTAIGVFFLASALLPV
jgi:urease accessory protein